MAAATCKIRQTMLIILRALFGLMLVASAACFVAYGATRSTVWRGRGMTLLLWTLGCALVFFGVLIVERMRLPG
jgi:hypothetical protein